MARAQATWNGSGTDGGTRISSLLNPAEARVPLFHLFHHLFLSDGTCITVMKSSPPRGGTTCREKVEQVEQPWDLVSRRPVRRARRRRARKNRQSRSSTFGGRSLLAPSSFGIIGNQPLATSLDVRPCPPKCALPSLQPTASRHDPRRAFRSLRTNSRCRYPRRRPWTCAACVR